MLIIMWIIAVISWNNVIYGARCKINIRRGIVCPLKRHSRTNAILVSVIFFRGHSSAIKHNFHTHSRLFLSRSSNKRRLDDINNWEFGSSCKHKIHKVKAASFAIVSRDSRAIKAMENRCKHLNTQLSTNSNNSFNVDFPFRKRQETKFLMRYYFRHVEQRRSAKLNLFRIEKSSRRRRKKNTS